MFRRVTYLFIFMIFSISAHSNAETIMNKLSYSSSSSRTGWEERGVKWVRWLAPSVRIGSASGTMVYYDEDNNDMYVLSAGHLFGVGFINSLTLRRRPKYFNIEIFYHNDRKLLAPKKYKAQLLCKVWNFSNGPYDVALLKFKPDWKDPWYNPIAPLDYKLVKDQWYHSTGCDGQSEIAHYLVRYLVKRKNKGVTEIVTKNNSPRGGRSGGGTFTDDGTLVFVCSRSHEQDDVGYWTSLDQIHKFLKDEKYEFILQGYAPARKIPIVDKNGAQGNYTESYIPLPKNQSQNSWSFSM